MSGRNTSARWRAEGPGPKTRDGCSVDLYLRLPYCGEAERLKPWLSPGASVLELGCGVGRITRRLLAAGHAVTAVDNSPDMLAHVPPEAEKVLCDIEHLQLRRTFDVVLLASCLINDPDDELRAAQLAKCRRHLRPGGSLLLERHEPDWLRSIAVGPLNAIGPVSMSVDEVAQRRDEVELCFRYEQGGDAWLQYFTARVLDDDDVRRILADAGFDAPTWIDRRWAAAVALARPSARARA